MSFFLANLTTGFNSEGLGLLEHYRGISSELVSLGGEDGRDFAYVLKVD
jgi:hypothetical protein